MPAASIGSKRREHGGLFQQKPGRDSGFFHFRRPRMMQALQISSLSTTPVIIAGQNICRSLLIHCLPPDILDEPFIAAVINAILVQHTTQRWSALL
jgi:hypothetical protein